MSKASDVPIVPVIDSSSGKEVIMSLRDICFSYQGEKSTANAIENINLDILKGEFICLLGPSGCGKSTLLNILAGFKKPTSGMAKMENTIIEGPDWHRGMVFQSPTLYPWLNVRKNVGFGPKMRKVPKDEIEKITDKYLGQVGLSEFGLHKPYELSGGMQQRAAFARALANNPRVILMDEPFGALDALTRENMQSLTRNLWAENNTTFFMITHDVDEALSLGTRVLVMSSRPGKIVEEIGIEFTYSITGNNSDRTRYSDRYLRIRDRVLDLIHMENGNYTI